MNGIRKSRSVVCASLLCGMLLVTGCRLLPITQMSPPLSQLAIKSDDIGNWTQQAEMEIYIGTQLYDKIDGGAPIYLDKGMIKSGFQVLEGPNNTLVSSMIMDFGRDSNAVAIYNEWKITNAGQTITTPQHPDTVAFLVIQLGGVLGYAHYKNYYFEISATGFSDMTQAIQTFDLFFNLYRKKVDSR